MNYDKIILELLDRIKTLEEKVAKLEGSVPEKPGWLNDKTEESDHKNRTVRFDYVGENISLTDLARKYIQDRKIDARNNGETELVLLANDIQKALRVSNRTPCICQAMYDQMEDDDEILFAPPSGKSTTVRVKYYIK